MFQQLSGGLIAGYGWRWRHLWLTELRAIQAFQIEGHSALWAIELPRAAHDDFLEIGELAAGYSGFEGLIRGQIHSPKVVVRQTFGECASLVGIQGVISVVHVRRCRNRGILIGHSDAKIVGLRYPLIYRTLIHRSYTLAGGSRGRTAKYSRGKLPDELAPMRTLWNTISFDDHK